ncbi:MAG: hypothetical protein AMXMBFR17_10730 [Candidatus Jettenia caeni]|nr:MAG: hypothetical protein JETCAE04_11190 [Candidatus Jettenia caeni]
MHEILKVKDALKLPKDDIRDIISESIEAIQLGNFKGTTHIQFRVWVRRIIQNKKNDYFRNKYKRKEHENALPIPMDDEKHEIILFDKPDATQADEFKRIENEHDVEKILQSLRKKVIEGEIEKNDLDLVQACYDGFKEGLSQEEIAKSLSLKPNTLNQNLSRLRKKLKAEREEYCRND